MGGGERLVLHFNPTGKPAERTGYYGAAGGTLTVTLDLAPNDATGPWTLRATDRYVVVRAPRSVQIAVEKALAIIASMK